MTDTRTKQERLSARARGYDWAWQKLRDRHLTLNRTCLVCGAPGQHVDHVVTIAEDRGRRLDPSNLQTLCARHHSILTAAYDNGRHLAAVDELGHLLDPAHPWHQARAGGAGGAGGGCPPRPGAVPASAKLKQRAIRNVIETARPPPGKT